MRIILIVSSFFLISTPAHAQWAVYDDMVHDQLSRVNKIDTFPGLGADKTYDNFEGRRDENGDVRMGVGSNQAVLKGL